MDEKGNPGGVNTGGGAYIGGGVNTGGGKFVGRDETIITGDGNVIGDHSQATVIKQANQGATVAEFSALLAQMRALLPQAGLDADTAEAVAADVKVVAQQAARPKPNPALIAAKLEGITKLLAAATGTAGAVEKLLPLARQAVQWAAQLFR